MSFAKLANSALVLSAAFQGSSAAVLPDRRFLLRPEQVNAVDHTKHQIARSPAAIVDVVKRAPQGGVEVAESEMLRLIDDVRAVELQMKEWLDGVTVSTPTSTPGDAPPVESVNPVEGVDLPAVSDPSQDELNTDIGDPLDVDAAVPADDREALSSSSSGCMMTVTATFTEFIFNGPSSEDLGFRKQNETVSLSLPAFETSLTATLPLEAGLESTSVSLESSALESLPVDENLVPFALSEDLEALPTSSLADLWESAAPSITPPPAVTDDPILEEAAEGSDGEIDLLSEEDAVTEEGPEEAEEAPEEEGDEQQAVAPPTEMALRFPGEGPSGIVWRTISLPSV